MKKLCHIPLFLAGRKLSVLLVTVFLLTAVLMSAPGYASQLPNHIRIADQAMYDRKTPDIIRKLLVRNLKYYQNGAAGPDVLNMVGKFSGLAVKAHYDRTGDLSKTMLRMAAMETDPVKREQVLAYTLGWIAHGTLDIFEHAVVNQYGGYFTSNAAWHKKLEMFESAYVFSTSVTPLSAFVTDSSALPSKFLVDAFHKEYPYALNLGFNEVLVYAAAVGMEGFTANIVEEFDTQKRSVTALANANAALVGEIPLCLNYTDILSPFLDYAEILSPLFVGIDSSYVSSPTESGSAEIRASFTYTVSDDGLMVSYISDWYASNRKALKTIIDKFNEVSKFLTLQNDRIEIAPDVDPNILNYNWDTGRLASTGEKYAEEVTKKFKRIDELELLWEIYDGERKVTEGTESIFLLQADVLVGSLDIKIPIPENIYSASGSSQRKMKATLRVKNNNTITSMPGPYATAFEFTVDEATCRTTLTGDNRVPIKATNEKTFWMRQTLEVKKGKLIQGKRKAS